MAVVVPAVSVVTVPMAATAVAAPPAHRLLPPAPMAPMAVTAVPAATVVTPARAALAVLRVGQAVKPVLTRPVAPAVRVVTQAPVVRVATVLTA
jgi:hypothetical protein